MALARALKQNLFETASEKSNGFQLKVVKRITLLMSLGALVWSIGMIAIGAYSLLLLPVGYLVIAGINFYLCTKPQWTLLACNIQVTISILFPCLFQLVAGGVMATGAVMLWSTVALFGISTYTPPKQALKWAIYTVVLIAGVVFFENTYMYQGNSIIDISPLKLLIFNSAGAYFVIFYVGYFFVTTVESTRNNLKKTASQAHELNIKLKKRNEEFKEGLIIASDIQDAFLKAEDHLRTVFTKSFLMRIPKEFITGNFIWAEQKSDLKYIICGECNSKGTSRGLLAMLMVSIADKILREYNYTDPTEFLTKFKEYITEDSGLDISKLNADLSLSMLIVNAETNKGKIAIAGGNIMVRRKNGKIEQHINKESFVCAQIDSSSLTSIELNLQIGDHVYMFTDGFLKQTNDQGERFGKERFKKLLSELDTEYSFMQKRKLAKVFKQWQSRAKQKADVLVCGFEIEDPALVYDLQEDRS